MLVAAVFAPGAMNDLLDIDAAADGLPLVLTAGLLGAGLGLDR